MKASKSVLVTGSKGFIGSSLVRSLTDLGYYVQEWSQDIRTIDSLKEPSDTVFHLAAITNRERFKTEPHHCFDVNVQGTLSVLKYCKAVGAKCIYPSTSGVYANNGSICVDELSEISPSSHYATSKCIGEELCQLEGKLGNVTSVILRIFNVYGRGQKQPFVIPYITDSLANDKNIIIETPNSVRDFVHISDVVDALVKSHTNNSTGCQIYNIGSGIPTTILDLARLCADISSTSGNISTTLEANRDQSGVYANTQKALVNLGWSHQKNLLDGLRALIHRR